MFFIFVCAVCDLSHKEVITPHSLNNFHLVFYDIQTFVKDAPRGNTNNVVFEQVRHKSGCTSTDKYPSSENKGADQLHSYCEADLRLCFRLCRLLVFPCGGSYVDGTCKP